MIFVVKIKKKFLEGIGSGRGGSGLGVRVDVNGEVKFFENSKQKWGGGGVGSVGRVGGQGGCEHRIEVLLKLKKKYFSGVGGCSRGVEVGLQGSG